MTSSLFSRVLMTLSLCHAFGRPHALNVADHSFCWMRPPPSADPSLLTWLCTSLSAGFGGAFLLSFTLVLPARLAPIPRLPILAVWSFSRSRSLSLKLVCSRSAASYLSAIALLSATALLSARGRASVCSGPCCESSPGPSVPIVALVLQLHNSFLCNLDFFLKLFDITSTISVQGVRISSGTFLF